MGWSIKSALSIFGAIIVATGLVLRGEVEQSIKINMEALNVLYPSYTCIFTAYH